MSRRSSNTVHQPSRSNQEYVTVNGVKKRNTAYTGSGKNSGSSSKSTNSVSAARGDFAPARTEYPELVSPTASYDSDPDVEYLLEDEYYLEELGYEDGEKPDSVDYSHPIVQSAIDSNLEFAREAVSETVSEWVDNLDDDYEYVLIEGENMGWMNRSGHKVITMDQFKNDPIDSIRPNTHDISQQWENKDGVLTAHQAHHDAQNEKYSFTPLSAEEVEEERWL